MRSSTGWSRRELLRGVAGLGALMGEQTSGAALAEGADLARAIHRDRWMHHPALGDPSWDAFQREPGNPIHTGRAPYLWPVNGFLFRDPPSGRWYAYVSVYPRGYWPPPPANCLLLRERAGGGWDEVGLLFGDAPPPFVGEGANAGVMTDASVVYDQGRYHLLYGWCDAHNRRGGLGYAWAERPEGPFHPAPQPVHDDAAHPPIMGRYVRAYASTLFRRRRDWLIVHMMSTPGNSGGTWALFAMTARAPEGPYSAPVPLLAPQFATFHPPLAEFYPAFAHDGTVYATATSVALNRSFQSLFRAPLERAHRPDAWRLAQYGSLWHTEPLPAEAHGIWGQTYSGQVGPDGTLRVFFPSRNRDDIGTIHMARRPWRRMMRDGFVLSAPNGPAVTGLLETYTAFTVRASIEAQDAWALCWGCRGPLGPDHHLADSSLHPLVRTDRIEWRHGEQGWTLVRVDAHGAAAEIARGAQAALGNGYRGVEIVRRDGETQLRLDGQTVWQGAIGEATGRIELVAEKGTVLRVARFALEGTGRPARTFWLSTEALSGAACAPGEWNPAEDAVFRYGIGHVSEGAGSRAKWNYRGAGFRLFAPKGPAYGTCRVRVDGGDPVDIDLHAPTPAPSAPILERSLPPGQHAVELTVRSGAVPCDVLEVLSA